MWRSWLARLVWDQEAGGSSPLTPTIQCSTSVELFSLERYILKAMDQNVFNQSIGTFIEQNLLWIAAIYFWSLFWKAVALWKSARSNDKVWFVIFLFVNTLGLLEILYIFHFSKQPGMPKTLSTKKDK